LRTSITSAFISVWLGQMQHRLLSVELDPDAALRLRSYLGAEPVQHCLDVFYLEIRVDGMGEDGVEDLALMMVHEPLPPLS
jgi:hypothetical protein